MSESENVHQLSRSTTPTWEVELLISGVAVFAMLQLPGWLDDRVFAFEPRMDSDWRQVLLLSYIYAKGAALILAATFVLHLLLRARWIALVGMHSVHPDGIRWDRLKMGPIQREIEQGLSRDFPERIERADNQATSVFAIGVMLAMFVVGIATTVGSAYLAAALLSHFSHGNIDTIKALLAMMAVVVLPFSLAIWLDRTRGATWARDSWPARAVAWVLRRYSKGGFSRNGNPIMSMLASHDGEGKTALLTTGLMMLSLAVVFLSLYAQHAPQRLGNYSGFPAPQASAGNRIDAAHYDDQRDPARDDPLPYVQSMVATEPYLALVIPYQPRRDEAAMRRSCAQADALPKAAQANARLACLAALHGVTLDGKPLANLHFEITSDPKTDRPALLAMIDVRDLPRGRHELQVARPPRSDRKPDKDDPGFDRIPFWN